MLLWNGKPSGKVRISLQGTETIIPRRTLSFLLNDLLNWLINW